MQNKIDISEPIAALVAVALRPYQQLIARLHADGRLSDQELKALHDETMALMSEGRLADEVKEEIKRAAEDAD